MNHLKIYENFDKKPYYYFDLVKFYNTFRSIFNELKSIDDKKNIPQSKRYSGEFFLLLNIIPGWKNLSLNSLGCPVGLIEKIIKIILVDKEVEFYNISENSGRVKSVLLFPYIFTDDNSFCFKIDLYGSKDFINVDYEKPFKIYGKPSKIEKYIEMILDTNKYNL
jgi:hypothetical protein